MNTRPLKTLSLLLALAAGLLSGCSVTPKLPTPMTNLTPPTQQVPSPAENPGSLYSLGQPSFLFEDNRAHRVGDIVMVTIVENSTSDAKTKTTTNKDSKMNTGLTNYFGENTFMGPTGVLGLPTLGMKGKVGTQTGVTGESKNEFSATGETQRNTKVTATVGCRVVNVLPGGTMQIEGARQMRINDETLIIVIRGLIRSYDVSPDNIVTSNQIADADISYYGQGILADRNKPGWLARILDNIWPF